MRSGLLAEIFSMAVETLRANKLRSFLTIVGMVIGVTSIVAMTALIRGFGDQMQQLIRQMGADTVYVAKMSIASFAAGREFFDLLKRPELTEDDAKAIRIGAPSVATVGIQLGGGPNTEMQRITYRDQSTKLMPIIGTTANFAETNYIEIENGRFFTDYEVNHRRNVVVLGYAPASSAVFDGGPGGQARPGRLEGVHRRRDDGQAAEPAHRKPGRVHGHSGDDLREGVRPAEDPGHPRAIPRDRGRAHEPACRAISSSAKSSR